MKKILTTALLGGAVAASLIGAGSASAGVGDQMYKVGKDIQPGSYTYTVTSGGYGSYYLCSTANCSIADDGIIDIETIDGPNGTTGYVTISPSVKFVKTYNLTLTPA